MEKGGTWIPLTPGKPFPNSSRLNCDAALHCEETLGTENINDTFPSMGSFNTFGCMEKCRMNEKCELPAGVLLNDEAVLGCVAEKDPKSTATVQNDTSCVQEEKSNISPSDGKKAQGVDESQAGFGSVPTPKTKYSRKRRTDDIDLNKKPNKRSRVKKHRPKVYDDSKPKKIPKVQTSRASTTKPKTPKPVTPVQRKSKFTGSTSYGLKNVGQVVPEASTSSIIDVKSCKRSLNFEDMVDKESHDVGQAVPEASTTSIVDVKSCKSSLNFEDMVDEESHDVSKSHEEHERLFFDRKCTGKIITAKRNTSRINRFQKKFLEPSEDLLRDTNEQKHGQCIYGISSQEQSQKRDTRYIFVYQRRKKMNLNITRVYQRSFRENQCLQNSKKCGPIFPKLFKKRRSLRKESTNMRNSWCMLRVEHSNRKLIQTTRKKSQKLVYKSKETRKVVKPDLQKGLLDRRVFLPPTRNRSVRHSRLRKNIMDLLTFKETPNESETYLLCNEESFLPIMDYPLPQREAPVHRINDFQRVDSYVDNLNSLQEVPLHRIESFTSHHPDSQKVDNAVGNLNSCQLQEVPVIENQSESQRVVLTQADLHRMYVQEILPFIIGKFASLDINGQCKELVVRNFVVQNIVVQNIEVRKALVTIAPPKKRKDQPKVDLDDESLRVWKLWRENEGSEPVEETDNDKEEWWERQREIFRGRVDSFNAKMHLIQGDRRFSPWKGSVTDSVVGAFLTQNVCDHLSSSAFMSVAARFPVKSRSREVVYIGGVTNSQESVTSDAKVGQRFSEILEIEQDMSTYRANVGDATPTTEDIHDKPCVDGNTSSFRKLLEIEEVDFLKQFCKNNDDEPKEEQNLSFFSLPSSSPEPPAITFDLNVGLCETSESEYNGQQKSTPEKEPIVLTREVRSLPSEVTIEQESEFTGQQKSIPAEAPIPVAPLCSLQSKVTIEQEIEFVDQHKSTPEKKPIASAPVCSLRSEVTFEQGVNAVDVHQKITETPLESRSTKEKKQENKTDWEEFRRRYCKTEGKETNENSMDSVDWDAVRLAPVKELAETIAERGMNNVLALRIKDFLDRIYKDHGSLDLEWLRVIPPHKAKEYLLSITGIGLKSVECIRLLTLHHLAFPVDTNVGRVATRLGWVPLQTLPDQVLIHLLNDYPMVDTIQKFLFPRLCTLTQKQLYELHYQLITFGKVFCTKRNPNCNACPMRGECRHYASAFASGRFALPAPKESSRVTSIVPAANEQNHSMLCTPSSSSLNPPVNNSGSSYHGQTCEPIIECPPSPVPEVEETVIGDIEDLFCNSEEEIPTIRLNTKEFRETLKDTLGASYISLPAADMSKALVNFTEETAKIRVPLKIVARLRTMHLVYELPDNHPVLAGFDPRELDDPSPYLLKIWGPDDIPKELDHTENSVFDSAYTNQEESLKGTILIPCRTANRGSFPLNGTYFQVNEVFADDETSHVPIDVPSRTLLNLQKRELGCGSSATSIFKGLQTHHIQRMCWRGSICVRGYNRKTRRPRPLDKKLHATTTTMAGENKKYGKR